MFTHLSDRLKSALKRLSGKGRLSPADIRAALDEVRTALLEADVALAVVEGFVKDVAKRAEGREVLDSLTPGQAVIGVVRDALGDLLGGEDAELNLAAGGPAVVLLAGLQGAGKTTTAGKLARHLRGKLNKRVAMVSTDVSRPAAREQLKQLAEQAKVDCFTDEGETDPVALAKAAHAWAGRQSAEILIVDTAGRLHQDGERMEELIALHKQLTPQETILVMDGSGGQDAATSSRSFAEAVSLTGVILTKLDGDARGGAALSVRAQTEAPIKFIGTGETLDALEAFHPKRIASRILGLGDVLSLIEAAEEKADKEKAAKIATKVARRQGLDLTDLRDQLLELDKMGGMAKLLESLPQMNPKAAKAIKQFDPKATRRWVAIINSMTPQERRHPALLRGSRKKRIAAGSGTQVADVNQVLKQFVQMQKGMKKMPKGGMDMSQMQNALGGFGGFGR